MPDTQGCVCRGTLCPYGWDEVAGACLELGDAPSDHLVALTPSNQFRSTDGHPASAGHPESKNSRILPLQVMTVQCGYHPNASQYGVPPDNPGGTAVSIWVGMERVFSTLAAHWGYPWS